jgi:hypothetical protein
MTLPPELAGVLPLLVAMLSNYLRSRQFAGWQNGLITFASLVIISLFAVWLTNGFTANLQQSALAVLGFIVLLAGREAFDLLSYLQAAPSPLHQKKPALWQPTTQQPTVMRANTRPLERQ